jgi:hypothetical protein
VRPELLLAAPFAAWALGAARFTPFALGCAVVCAPWAWHAFVATGSPGFNMSSYLLIAYTRTHPGLSPLWDFGIPPARWPATLAASLPELPAKWFHYAPRAIKHLLMAPAPGLGLASALGAVAAVQTPRSRRLAWAALGTAAIPLLLCTTTESSERYVAVFLPLWAAAAVHGADAVAGTAARARWARAALLAVLLPFWIAALASETRQSASLRRWLADERAALASRSAPGLRGRLLFSDTPDFAAWTTRRPTIATTPQAYATLPSAAADALHPARGTDEDEWFHADLRAIPAPTHGGSAAALAAAGVAPPVAKTPAR